MSRGLALAHRLSGLALALFLPVHFWVLARALQLDAFLAWTEQPAVKFAEWGLVTLLALHLAGGVRVLMLEFLPWRDWAKGLAALAAGCALAAGLAFALAL
ncbi:MAG: succinate dehydrogenase [Betaproteobacteria bacterium]|nr:succinate dehydrogenase [Betaproteobacteria bacterium]